MVFCSALGSWEVLLNIYELGSRIFYVWSFFLWPRLSLNLDRGPRIWFEAFIKSMFLIPFAAIGNRYEEVAYSIANWETEVNDLYLLMSALFLGVKSE